MYGKSAARTFLGEFIWAPIPLKLYQNTSGCGTMPAGEVVLTICNLWDIMHQHALYIFRSQSEMNRTCRGAINLAGAFIDTVDSCSFVINGGSQVWHLRAASEIERQRWVTTLELAKAKAIKNLGSGNSIRMFHFCDIVITACNSFKRYDDTLREG